MPVFTLFFSLILASIVGIILSTVFNENGHSPEWINQVFLSIIGAGVLAAAITKKQLCKICALISFKKVHLCQCQHS